MRHLLPLLFLGISLTSGCRWFEGPSCDDPSQALAGAGDAALTCADAGVAERYVEVLSGRTLGDSDRRELAKGLVRRYKRDPVGTRTQLASAKKAHDALMTLTGLDAAEQRSTLVYHAATGTGAFGKDDDDLKEVLERSVAVWKRSDAEKLALTEVDIEGWIYYASLCREVQDASPLRLSVADRVVIYRDIQERYGELDRPGKIAMSGIGAFWPNIKAHWQIATYEEQQQWIRRAPLPPPMVSTSKAYLAAIFEGDVVEHARILQRALGPFRLGVFK